MRLVELKAENFKRLIAVRIRPGDGVTPIVGKNGAGKTSVLDAITAALGGMAESPDLPIRRGATEAEIVVDLGDIVVERRWSAKGRTTLEVRNAEGHGLKSPQAILDKLFGQLSFDPLAFTRMKPAEQAQILARLAGIDLAAHTAKRQAAYDQRAAANKSAKDAKARFESMPEVIAPDEPVNVTDLFAALKAAEATNRKADEAVAASERVAAALAETERGIADRKEKLAALQAEIEKWEGHRAKKLAELEAAGALATTAAAERIDTAPIEERIKSSEAVNAKVRQKQEKAMAAAASVRAAGTAKLAEEALSKIDSDHESAVAAAALPIPGIAFGSGGVTLNGIPFSQCSGAEKLRTSVAVGLALNPKLKLMLIRDGSLLDDEGMALLASLAEGADAQVLIERVDNGSEVGVQIVDGETVEAETAVAAGAN